MLSLIHILPGDIVVGTKNGVLFVPSHMVDFVIENAYKMQVRDLYAFPKLREGVYTTADVDAPVWSEPMLRELFAFIETKPEAEKYRDVYKRQGEHAAQHLDNAGCDAALRGRTAGRGLFPGFVAEQEGDRKHIP